MDDNNELNANVSYDFIIPDVSDILSLDDTQNYTHYDTYFKTASSIDTLKKIPPVFYALLNHEELTETSDKGITEFILARNTVTNEVRLVSPLQQTLKDVPDVFIHYSFLKQVNTYFKKIVGRDLSDVEKKSILSNMEDIEIYSAMSVINGMFEVGVNIINVVDIYDTQNFYDVFTKNFRIIPHFVSFELEENEIPLIINFKMAKNANNVMMINEIDGVHVTIQKDKDSQTSYQYEPLSTREMDSINQLLKDNFILNEIVSKYNTIARFI